MAGGRHAARGAKGGDLHVLTLTPFYPTERDDARGCFVAEPLAALEAAGVRSTVLVARPLHRAWRDDRVRGPAAEARFACVPSNAGLAVSGLFLAAAVTGRVRRLHAEQPIDVIHAHSALPCGYAARSMARRLGVPFVVTVHGLDVLGDVQAGRVSGRWCAPVSRGVYRAARRVICVSARVEAEVRRTGGVRTVVVHNGVDPVRFRPGVPATRGEAGTIVSVGNLIPIKGHDLLLRAIARVSARFPHARLDIIGDGTEASRLRALAAELGLSEATRFLGRRSRQEVARALGRCSVFALPSHYEGLGCVYLEAMAAARPVVACRGQGIGEIIRHGENGVLVAPGEVDELADALAMLLGDASTRERLGVEARNTVVRSLTHAHQAERLERVYRACVP